MKFSLKFDMIKGEYWYGGQIGDGVEMPVNAERERVNDSVKGFGDQSTPLFISNKGRYVWSDDGYVIKFDKGGVTAESDTAEIKLYEGFGTLRGAYLAASKRHFPPDGNMPDELMFRIPQYCTWIEMKKLQRQSGVLKYARSIINSGMPAGEIIIDDGWQRTFGDWEFKNLFFKNPGAMIDELHGMGFKVILWIVPFVSPKSPSFSYLKENGCLVRNADGSVAMRKWWDGTSAVLDMSEPKAFEWFTGVCRGLMEKYGVDGFKQDAADNKFYRADDITAGGVSPNGQTELWMRSALQFPFNELRASWKAGGVGVAQRLGDKRHRWEKYGGLRALIPNSLLLGLTGHPFSCPDMIGGGWAADFWKPQEFYDHELFIRWAECSTLMPMMQYSLSLWRLRNKRTAELCRAAAKFHLEFSDYIVKYANAARMTGEPIVRYMEYSFPNEGMEEVNQQFMLGDDYLVAPVVDKGAREKEVKLPKGEWKRVGTDDICEGGRAVTVKAEIDELPIFKLMKKN
ncbi:MAG: glycoside hydrolase family 31 protein [Clostridiales bacterium]|jgi:alpha-glucosidase (family GH31 glycosyl hydrolase)|nr:glycoside hydrolase family 31 protein [Clostridiales bacterium]